jgi:hypothetical protein
LEEAHRFFERRAWCRSFEAFAAADASDSLAVDDLESFAIAASLAGHDGSTAACRRPC